MLQHPYAGQVVEFPRPVVGQTFTEHGGQGGLAWRGAMAVEHGHTPHGMHALHAAHGNFPHPTWNDWNNAAMNFAPQPFQVAGCGPECDCEGCSKTFVGGLFDTVKDKIADPATKRTMIAVGLIAGAGLLLAVYNPKHRLEIGAAAAGLTAFAVGKGLGVVRI